ncbi:hypothetical protein [Paenibacillus brevis]|uniref:Uncharacterized protein n=1 Tax=Paenibacillus brevis TaxID=2841508 RepID=A0ABS6FLE4_9BACL|nr:hypothetical protein [Paenibacillus brevis]MBU5670986.1 hypothetical protein [Paenibacillus brevis]
MEVIDRYVHAVIRRLPEGMREDIRKELHGLIEDMLEEQAAGPVPTPEEAEQVLLHLGHPAAMAAKYRGHERYLVGPQLFESYLSVIKVVMIAVIASLSVIFVVETALRPNEITDQFTSYITSIVSAASQGFVWVTVVFAMIEYGIRKKTPSEYGSMSWRPSDLPPIPDSRAEIKLSEPIAGIIFTVLFTIVLLSGAELLAIYTTASGELSIVPFINFDVLYRFWPFIVAFGVAGVGKEIYKMLVRQRTAGLLAYHIIFSVAGVIFAGFLLSEPGFWNPAFMEQLQATGIFIEAGNEFFEPVSRIWETVTGNLIYLIILITLIDIGSEVFKWLRLKKAGPITINIP